VFIRTDRHHRLNLAVRGLNDRARVERHASSPPIRLARWRVGSRRRSFSVVYSVRHSRGPAHVDEHSNYLTATPDGVARRWRVMALNDRRADMLVPDRALVVAGLWAVFRDVAALDLHLVPTHPDRAAGLGFLGEMPSFGAGGARVILSARGFEMVRTAGGAGQCAGRSASSSSSPSSWCSRRCWCSCTSSCAPSSAA
jgi:hypothetical protein